jgi:hypothetical protein
LSSALLSDLGGKRKDQPYILERDYFIPEGIIGAPQKKEAPLDGNFANGYLDVKVRVESTCLCLGILG